MRIASGVVLLLASIWSILGGGCGAAYGDWGSRLAELALEYNDQALKHRSQHPAPKAPSGSVQLSPSTPSPSDILTGDDYRDFGKTVARVREHISAARTLCWFLVGIGALGLIASMAWLAGRWRWLAATAAFAGVACEVVWIAWVQALLLLALVKLVLYSFATLGALYASPVDRP